MRIGFDARLINQTGVGRYIRNLLEQFKKLDKRSEFYIFLSPESFDNFKLPDKNWHKIKTAIPWHSAKEQLFIPLILLRYRLDLVHFPYFNVPILYPGKYLVTIHDLIIDHFPSGRASTLPYFFYKIKRVFYHFIMQNALSRASRILAISKATKREIVEHYHIDPDKISVTYDALGDDLIKFKKNKSLLKLYDFDYLLYVGNAYPHKNLEMLCLLLTDKTINSKVKLILAGDDYFFYPRLKEFALKNNISANIIFAGNADDRKLSQLYTFARGLVTPSLMEGFGLPNLEAVYFGCLPLVSDIPVFREIWGGDLIYFNPHDKNSLKEQVLKLLTMSAAKRNKILSNAKKNLPRFSWLKTANKTLLQYRLV